MGGGGSGGSGDDAKTVVKQLRWARRIPLAGGSTATNYDDDQEDAGQAMCMYNDPHDYDDRR